MKTWVCVALTVGLVTACGEKEPPVDEAALAARIKTELKAELKRELKAELLAQLGEPAQPAAGVDSGAEPFKPVKRQGGGEIPKPAPVETPDKPVAPVEEPATGAEPAVPVDEPSEPVEDPTEPTEEPTEEPAAESAIEVIKFVISRDVDRKTREPVGAGTAFEAEGLPKLYAFLVAKNAGEKVPVTIQWDFGGKTASQIDLDVGHSTRGWRTWATARMSVKRRGEWTVRVVAPGGAVLAETAFTLR